MTREQMATWLDDISTLRYDDLLEPELHALSEIAAYLRQSCATCQHADTEHMADGWCYCAAPARQGMTLAERYALSVQYPFRYRTVPLDERCKGYTMRQDA